MATWLFWLCWGLIAYTYFLFPLLLALLARWFGRPAVFAKSEETEDDALPRVAMIVAAYNEESVIRAKLANTWAIDYPRDRFRLYIGSDGSSDRTAEYLQACADPRLETFLFAERRGKISVLNDLVPRVDAETPILVMSDASTLFAPDAVRKLVRHFQDPRVGCVTGEFSVEQKGDVSGEGLYLKYERWIKRNEGRLGCVIGCFGPIFAIRRECYTPLPPNTIIEDFVFCLRVLEQGLLARAEPEARATDPACADTQGEMKRKIRIGAGGFQALGLTRGLLHPRHGVRAFAYWGHKALRWLVPFFFLGGLAANIALLSSRWYQGILAAQVVGALVAYWAYRTPPERRLPKWTRPVSYFYLMNYALFRGFLRFCFGSQRVTWDRAAHAASPMMTMTVPMPSLPSDSQE